MKKKIAIIGTGISGLAAASMLHQEQDITVYEQAKMVGGHARTKIIRYNNQEIAVDTGFIVFNHQNYPNLTQMFRHFDVPIQKSIMSFGVTAQEGGLEWSAENANSLFGQRSNFFNLKFYRFLLEILKFNKNAVRLKETYANSTLAEMVADMGLSDYFSQYYILPMAGAIWSCSLAKIMEFPARTFIEFFDAHGLLTVTQQPQWYTVTGGSKVYLEKITKDFQHCIKTNCGVVSVKREQETVIIADAKGELATYDEVVFACHADQALALLEHPTVQEREILGAFQYQNNTAYLHRDAAQMPKRKACWASWIYQADDVLDKENIAVTYWMNHLQGIDANYPLFLTLNPRKNIKETDIFDVHEFRHPVYSQNMIQAQKQVASMQGNQHTWFCGAYLKYGFHEDGISSGMEVARQLGGKAIWQ